MSVACNDGGLMHPLDKSLLIIKDKWEGNYIGTVYKHSYTPYYPPHYDTLYDQKIAIINFSRDSIYEDYVKVSMEFNDDYIDSGYYGLEVELLSDSALLLRFDEGFTHSQSKIYLNYIDSTLITDYKNYPFPGGGSNRQGFYKKK